MADDSHPPLCMACGYDLRETPPEGHCPECRHPVARSAEQWGSYCQADVSITAYLAFVCGVVILLLSLAPDGPSGVIVGIWFAGPLFAAGTLSRTYDQLPRTARLMPAMTLSHALVGITGLTFLLAGGVSGDGWVALLILLPLFQWGALIGVAIIAGRLEPSAGRLVRLRRIERRGMQ